MNPYARFRLVSNTVSAALIVAGLAVLGAPVFGAIAAAAGPGTPALFAAMAGAVGVLVVFWLAMTEAIFPSLFRFNAVRRWVLGKYYVEGTWLQAERGTHGGNRLAVIDIQPSGQSFIFSGYALNKDLEIESNTLIEFSKFEWPFMTFKYRNSLSDGSDGQRDGVGEIQFEMNRSAASRYNGFAQFVKSSARMKIEGAKLVKNTEVKRLRSLEGRKAILEKYWNLFFNSAITSAQPAAAAEPRRAVIVARRDEAATSDPTVVPRRRASDWRGEDATPAADRVRARLDAVSDETLEDEDEDEYEDETAENAADDEDMIDDDADAVEADAEDDAEDETPGARRRFVRR